MAGISTKASNLDECVNEALDHALNLRTAWGKSDYKEKQRMQFLVFPEGLFYSKKEDTVRTNRINSVFACIAQLSQELAKNKCGIPLLNMEYADLVAPRGIEPPFKV